MIYLDQQSIVARDFKGFRQQSCTSRRGGSSLYPADRLRLIYGKYLLSSGKAAVSPVGCSWLYGAHYGPYLISRTPSINVHPKPQLLDPRLRIWHLIFKNAPILFDDPARADVRRIACHQHFVQPDFFRPRQRQCQNLGSVALFPPTGPYVIPDQATDFTQMLREPMADTDAADKFAAVDQPIRCIWHISSR